MYLGAFRQTLTGNVHGRIKRDSEVTCFIKYSWGTGKGEAVKTQLLTCFNAAEMYHSVCSTL